MTPGPAEVPPETLLELARPVFHHRTSEFRAILAQVTDDLKYVFGTEADVFVFTASGTGAMEASVVNLLRPGDKAVCVRGGKFGERWGELAERFGAEVIAIDPAWGDPPDPEAIRKALAEHPDEMPLRADAWGVDMVVVGSQKALLLPPGLAFLSVSEKAWKRVDAVPSRGYYFDLKAARKAMAGKGDTPYTPANTLVAALARSLRMIREEGIESVWARHHKLAEATRQAARALGLELLASAPSDAVTAITMPEGVDADALRKILRGRYGVSVAGGQAALKGRIIRIGHFGYIDTLDTLGALAALEMALAEMGAEVPLGAGVAAAQKALMAD